MTIRAAQEFEDPAWRNYDEAFREKSAATGNRKWSEIDSLIYNRVFTGHAKKIPISSPGPRHSDFPGPLPTPAQHIYYSDPPPPKCPAPMPPALPTPPPPQGVIYATFITMVHAVMATFASSAICAQFALDATPKCHARQANPSRRAQKSRG